VLSAIATAQASMKSCWISSMLITIALVAGPSERERSRWQQLDHARGRRRQPVRGLDRAYFDLARLGSTAILPPLASALLSASGEVPVMIARAGARCVHANSQGTPREQIQTKAQVAGRLCAQPKSSSRVDQRACKWASARRSSCRFSDARLTANRRRIPASSVRRLVARCVNPIPEGRCRGTRGTGP
jgi:hypothetical protein